MNPAPVLLLIVDDDPVFAQFVRQMVISLGSDFPCLPQVADSVEKAMEELRCGTYELVLLDYNLPGANGLEMLGQIHQLPDRQPAVIMLTGSGNETIAVEAMKRGARDYLCKADLDVPPLVRALRNALAQKHLADQIAAYNAQTRADLELARNLQQSLLPESYPSFPHAVAAEESDFRFAHRFFPASELAGDFFSVFPLSDTRAGIFICDVMGHGVRSALVTAMVRALVDNAAPAAADPGQFLAEMNRRLAGLLKSTRGPMFATACYLIADVTTGELAYATAGHPPALHLQRQSESITPLRVPSPAGPALGLFAEAAYAVGARALAEGDVILLFTDGLYEVTSADDEEEYGLERLLASTRQHLHLPAPDLCDALIADARKFAENAPLADDVCLLSMEVARLRKPPGEAIIQERQSIA
jgi:sigma-B regulation protein RsbU (phosphoserine phosphatase)